MLCMVYNLVGDKIFADCMKFGGSRICCKLYDWRVTKKTIHGIKVLKWSLECEHGINLLGWQF